VSAPDTKFNLPTGEPPDHSRPEADPTKPAEEGGSPADRRAAPRPALPPMGEQRSAQRGASEGGFPAGRGAAPRPVVPPMGGQRSAQRGASEGGFLSRWSRRKRAAEAGQRLPEPAAPPSAAPPPAELPDPATLSFADDFSAYLGAQVPAALKRAAMAKLFADPSFNRMDGLDVYIEDYNLVPELSAEERALLAHAREVLNPGSPPGAPPGQASAQVEMPTEDAPPCAMEQAPGEPGVGDGGPGELDCSAIDAASQPLMPAETGFEGCGDGSASRCRGSQTPGE
jgi:uncharacterized protein DUF3306